MYTNPYSYTYILPRIEITTPGVQDTGIELWAPENVVRLFESTRVDVDIRQLIRADGSLDPEAADRAQEEYDEFLEEMQRENSPREWFRDRNRK